MTKADRKSPVRVILAVGSVEIAAWVQRAGAAATAGRCLVIIGLVPLRERPRRHRGGWRVSLSHWGRPPVGISVHRYKRGAHAQVLRVKRARVTRDLRDDGTFAALIQELAAFSDGEAE